MGQFLQQGHPCFFETLFTLSEEGTGAAMDYPIPETALDYLVGKTLNQINKCAERGVFDAHVKAGIPRGNADVFLRSAVRRVGAAGGGVSFRPAGRGGLQAGDPGPHSRTCGIGAVCRRRKKQKSNSLKRVAFSISQSYHRKRLLLCAYAVEPAEKLVQHYDFVGSEHADFLNNRNGFRSFLQCMQRLLE